MNHMKHQLSKNKFALQPGINEISRYEIITLEETYRGSLVLLFIGLLSAVFSLIFELIKQNFEHKNFFRHTRITFANRVAW